MKTGTIDRKPTKDNNIDIGLFLEDGHWATALIVNDCGRAYGIQQHADEAQARAVFADRDVTCA